MGAVLGILLVLLVNGLVLFAFVNFGLSFWHRWRSGVPAGAAALDALLARRSAPPS